MHNPSLNSHVALMVNTIMFNLHAEDNYDISDVDELELAKILNEKYREYLG